MSDSSPGTVLNRKRVLLAILAVTVVAAAVWAAFAPSSQTVTWAEARIDDMVMRVDVEGTIASTDSSMLTPPATARRMFDFTIAMMAPEGEEVGAGTPVLAFDTSDLQIRLRDLQTRAQQASKNLERLDRNLEQQRLGLELRLAQAEANLRQAQLQVEVPEDLSSARELEKARLDLRLAEIEVESVKLQIEAAEQSAAAQRAVLEGNRTRAERDVAELEATMEQMTVRAPRSGTVIYVSDRMGQKKKVGDSAWRNEEIIELPDLRSLVGRGEVNEPDAGRIAEGQPFRIRLDAHPEIEYTGVIGSISRAVQRKSFSRNPLKAVRVELSFEETDPVRMRPGMRFRGTIETERIPSVLLIPSSAVFPSADGPIVYRNSLVGSESVPVTLGRRNATQVEVLEGLQPGDLVAETNPEGS
ncbi:MAG: HlyD family efflux transporter periplasmic adaptor subunit [Acidobacteriota bacterium]|jgi:multidrug efflux pump subunit AcrA (membrane-fusion protein)